MNTLTFKKNPCPICGNPNTSIWDYCLKCMKDFNGWEGCFKIEQIKKKGEVKKDVPVQNQ